MKWPDQLIREISARRAVLFFGAGVSMNSVGRDGRTRPMTWSEFLRVGARKIGPRSRKIVKQIEYLIDRNDLLTACEVVKGSLGRDDFVTLVKNVFQEPGFRPAEIHEHLWGLDLRITITPNIDNIYDSLVAERGDGTVSVKSYKDDDVAEVVRRRERVLIKSHGTITSPHSMIFTRSEYAKARNEHRAFYELIYSLLSTHTFLFVGCGLDDPDIRYLLEDYRYRNGYAQKHYFVFPREIFISDVLNVFEDSLNLGFITYSKQDGHRELTQGLADLRREVDLNRPEMGRSQSW